jgi:hypothetical protein
MSAQRRIAAFGIVLAATVAAACADYPVLPAGSRDGPDLVGTDGTETSLVGEWTREIVFFDDFGFANSSKTVWLFQPGGSATRSVVATTFTLGVADTIITQAAWEVQGTTVEIEFGEPTPGTITLDFRLEGDSLLLAGQSYQRTG